MSDYRKIQQAIFKALQADDQDRSSTTFVLSNQRKEPVKTFAAAGTPSSIELFDLETRAKQEKWYNIMDDNGDITLADYNAGTNQSLQATIIISILVSLFLVLTFLILLGPALRYTIKKLVSTSGQFNQYSNTTIADNKADDEEQAEAIKISPEERKKEKKKHVPSILSALDYQTYLWTRKRADSTIEFFNLLFKRASGDQEDKLMKGELESEELLQIKGTQYLARMRPLRYPSLYPNPPQLYTAASIINHDNIASYFQK